jgi:hypothetical protein
VAGAGPAALLPGRRSIEQIIDGYGVECASVRDLLVDYFTERSAELDHNSVRAIAGTLCSRFWRDLEIHHPGIASLRLPTEIAQAWKERLRHVRTPDGQTRPRAGYRHELVFVRAFYQDIARWAADDPARWGPWVAPCPIKATECQQQRTRLRRKAAMDQRTRTRLPVLPALLRAVEGHRDAAGRRLQLACDVPAGTRFTAHGEEFLRHRTGESARPRGSSSPTRSTRGLSFGLTARAGSIKARTGSRQRRPPRGRAGRSPAGGLPWRSRWSPAPPPAAP